MYMYKAYKQKLPDEEYQQLLNWAEEEIREWQEFIEELKKRHQ